MKVLTIANRKGGAGKSTCAAHLAMESVKKGKKTILIDLDPQKTLETWWEKREAEEPYLTEANSSNLKEKIEKLKEIGFDLCIIDTPGDTSLNAMKGIQASDLVLVPSKATAPDLSAIGRTIATLKEEKKDYMFLLTQTVPNSKNSIQALSILSEFGPVAPCTIDNRVVYSNAMGGGFSATEDNKLAAEEIGHIWKYIESKIFEKKESNKRKVA